MADHNVMLNYDGVSGFQAAPERIKVRQGHKIAFRLGAGPQNGQVRVTFQHPQFFSVAQFHSGDPDVEVTSLPTPTTYRCELLVNGNVVAQSSENAGGGIDPETGN